jgi:ABC-type multidrug transport system fused ATPase/permease subunit
MSQQSRWQQRQAGKLQLKFPAELATRPDLDDILARCTRTVDFVREALRVEADSLPRIAIFVAEAEGGRESPPDSPREGAPHSDLTIWTTTHPEATRPNVEAELTRALLRHYLGPPSAKGTFWDEGFIALVGARVTGSAVAGGLSTESRGLDNAELLPPLAQLVSESDMRLSGVGASAAGAFAEYLVERHGLPRYVQLMRQSRAGTTSPFHEIYDVPLAVADRDWRRHLQSASEGGGPSVWTVLRRLLPLARPYWRSAVAILGLILVSIGFSLVLPLSFRFLIDNVLGQRPLAEAVPLVGPASHVIQPGQEQTDVLVKMMVFLGSLYLVNAAARLRLNYMLNVVGESFAHDLRSRLVGVVACLPASYFANVPPAHVSQTVVQDTTAVQQVITRAVVPMIRGVLSVLLFGIMLVLLAPKLALVPLMGLPVIALIYGVRRHALRSAARERVRRLADLSAGVNELCVAQNVVKVYSIADFVLERLRRRMAVHRQLNIALAHESSRLGQVGALTMSLTQVAVLVVGGYLVVASRGSEMGIGTLVAFYVLLNQVLLPVGQVASASQSVAGAAASVERVSQLLRERTEDDTADGVERGPLAEKISFEGVSLSFPDDRPVLSGLSLDIPAGATVAFVGPTGGGKSSIVQLLPRLFDPTGGRITWDGIDIRHATRASLRQRVVLVGQDAVLLSASVYDNVRLGMNGVGDADVERAARLARAHHFVERLPDGYDTIVGQRGHALSGGQQQRVALARALLRKPSVLILDEATSALDAITQRQVDETLRSELRDTTIIKIAHRLETVADADIIFVLDGGRLVERGTHAELLAIGGLYRRLFDDQTRTLGTAPESTAGGDTQAQPAPPAPSGSRS